MNTTTINGVAFNSAGSVSVNSSPSHFTVATSNGTVGQVRFGASAAFGAISATTADLRLLTNGAVLCRNTANTTYVNCQAADFLKSSSKTIKENIRPLDAEIDNLLQIEPVSFDYKEGVVEGSRHRLGLIAEDTAGLFPTAVAQTDSNDASTLGISYTEFIAPLIALCQRQQKAIDTLNEQMAELKSIDAK